MNRARNFFGSIVLVVLFVAPPFAMAIEGNVSDPFRGNVSEPSVQSGPSAGFFSVQNPLGNVRDFNTLLKKLLDAAIIIGIPIAVLFIVYAGFKFVFARGNEKSLAEAKQNFFWTIVGIVIFLGAWLIARVLAETIRQLGAPLQ